MADDLTNNTSSATNDEAAGRVITGYSRLYYRLDNGTPTVLADAVDVSVSSEVSDDVKFYADNQEAASASGSFTTGTLTLTVSGITETVARALYGLDAASGSWTAYDASKTIPFVKVGFLIRYQSNQLVTYVPVILTKCQFKPRATSAATQEADISFQTESLEATIFEDDDHLWKIVGQGFDTEGETTSTADSALKALYDKMNS